MILSSYIRRLLRGGIVALVIKVGAAGLQFLMFLFLARSMSSKDYGVFGFGFSLATLLSVGGSFGQRMLSLRYLSIYLSEASSAYATGLVRDGLRIILCGTALLGTLTILIMPLFEASISRDFLVYTTLFAIVLSLAEYMSFMLRSYGSMLVSLGPKDVLWRLLVVLVALPCALDLAPKLTEDSAMIVITALLCLSILIQSVSHPAARPHALFMAPAAYERVRWLKSAWGLWGTSFIQVAAPNVTIIILGLLLSPEETGPIFSALRIALLLNLVLLSANMVVSPSISRMFHEGRRAELQRTCSGVALISTAASLLFFFFLVIKGDAVLNLFGESYDEAYATLLIVCGAYVINTLTGPTSVLLELTGHERAAFRMITICNIAAISAMPLATWMFGAIGAGTCLALSITGWNVQAVLYARMRIGIDPSVLGWRRGKISS